MPRLNLAWIGLFVASAAAIIALVSVVGYESYKEGTKSKSKYNAYGVDVNSDDDQNSYTNWTDASLALALYVTVDTFDPNKAGNTLGFHIDYYPINDLNSPNATLTDTPSVPVRILLQSVTTNFAANTVMPSQSVSQILDGDINRYPFDVFRVDYQIDAFTSPGNGTYGTPLPMTIYALGAIQGFKVDTIFQGIEDDGSGVKITFVIKRSPITKAFSVIIIIVMWFLSAGIFIAAMSVWFRERKVELPLIAISTALLFALPNVRNSQPGIPSVAGTTSDMVGFFWNLLLVAASAISLIANFVIKSRRDPVKPKPAADAPAAGDAPAKTV
ncbi:DUF4436 domain-containing protein [Mycena sanguinolenta]|uniref:DUF4436 domain-containing protein n=1 Tax=Mycena sanguinolenta TaxID=230812 RepID=A0A8H7CW81_9AGAR|nr:DUF4436 domain-containing protein [Mycena sanguinolenta]